MVEAIGMVDKLDVYVQKKGSNHARLVRTSAPTGCIKSKIVAVLQKFGLGTQYCGDLIVTAGLQERAASIATTYVYVGAGTGTTTPAQGDVDCQYPYLTRVVAATAITTTTYTNDTAQISGTITAAGTVAITEAVLAKGLTTAGGGNILSRQTFAAVNLDAGDTLIVVFKIQQGHP